MKIIWFPDNESGTLYLISEAILALQSEVSRLREELQECLTQLPHLAQEMEDLTSASKLRSRQLWMGDPSGAKSDDSTGSGNLQYTKPSAGGRTTPEFKGQS